MSVVSRVVDKNCGITSCAKVWKRKIDFDPRCSTFDPRFPSKGTNIKRDLTRHHKRIRDTNDKFHPFCDGGKQYKLYWAGKNCFISISINPTCSFICLWQFLSENISNFGESVCSVCSLLPVHLFRIIIITITLILTCPDQSLRWF